MFIVSAMVSADSRLDPFSRASAAWEMDLASADALVKVMGGPGLDIGDVDAGSIQCLGLPVRIVEQPGVRLVITVVPS